MANAGTERTGSDSTSVRGYHHGNLRRALLEAALELAQRHGPERVSVREAARLVGVSPGAPFRHFPNRRALMTALAEEAGEHLRIEVRKSMGGRRGSPLRRLGALGRGYLQWAMRHPSHFKILSARDQIDLEGSTALRNSIGEVRVLTEQTLAEAQHEGEVDPVHAVTALALLARATVYGLARMQQDGHLGQWGVAAGDEAAAMTTTLDLLIALMRRAPGPELTLPNLKDGSA
jgi:AcrR family transcriptional regulator